MLKKQAIPKVSCLAILLASQAILIACSEESDKKPESEFHKAPPAQTEPEPDPPDRNSEDGTRATDEPNAAGYSEGVYYVQDTVTTQVGVCTEIRLEYRDETGTPTFAPKDSTLTVIWFDSHSGIYSDAECQVRESDFRVKQNEQNASFWFKADRPMTATLEEGQTFLVQGGVIRFKETKITTSEGECTPVVIQNIDFHSGDVTSAKVDTHRDVSMYTLGTYFYSDDTCNAVVDGRITVAAGKTEATFWFKSDHPGSGNFPDRRVTMITRNLSSRLPRPHRNQASTKL